QRRISAGRALAAAERLARVEPGARRDPLPHREPLVARQLRERVLRRERAWRPLELLRGLDLQAGPARLRQPCFEAVRALLVLQQLAVAVEPAFLLEDPHPAAEDHLVGRGVQVEPGGVVLVAALPEQGRSVRRIPALVAP